MSAEYRTIEEYTQLVSTMRHITVEQAKETQEVKQFEKYLKEKQHEYNS